MWHGGDSTPQGDGNGTVDQSLMTVVFAFYLLLKMARAPRETANVMLDVLRGEALSVEPALPVDRRSVDAAMAEAVNLLKEGHFPEAFGRFTAIADTWIGLVEQGRLEGAARLLERNLLRRMTDSDFSMGDALQVMASAVKLAETGVVDHLASEARVNLFAKTDGAFQEAAHWLIAAHRPAPPDKLGADDRKRLDRVLGALLNDGYHILDQRVPTEMCERIVAYATTAPASSVPPSDLRAVDLTAPTAEGFNISPQAAFDCPDVRALLRAPSFLEIATAQLGCAPVFCIAALRWSLPPLHIPAARTPSVDLAQMHHWDAGWTRWINFFFYLTDVDSESGPHVYVRGTHRPGAKPRELLQRGYTRIPDEDIERFYPTEDIVTLTGPQGSIIVGDTRCWHKGLPPVSRRRLTLQFIFADSLVAAPALEPVLIRRDYDPAFRAFVAEHPSLFPQPYFRIEADFSHGGDQG